MALILLEPRTVRSPTRPLYSPPPLAGEGQGGGRYSPPPPGEGRVGLRLRRRARARIPRVHLQRSVATLRRQLSSGWRSDQHSRRPPVLRARAWLRVLRVARLARNAASPRRGVRPTPPAR